MPWMPCWGNPHSPHPASLGNHQKHIKKHLHHDDSFGWCPRRSFGLQKFSRSFFQLLKSWAAGTPGTVTEKKSPKRQGLLQLVEVATCITMVCLLQRQKGGNRCPCHVGNTSKGQKMPCQLRRPSDALATPVAPAVADSLNFLSPSAQVPWSSLNLWYLTNWVANNLMLQQTLC